MSKETYLAGSMSGRNNYGIGWRNREKRWLKSRGQSAFSPPDRELGLLVKYDITPSMLRTKLHKLPASLRRQLFQEIIRFDLEQIKYRTNYLICFLTEYSVGTVSELTWAYMCGIPVYIVTRKQLKPWVAACATKLFKNFEQLHWWLAVKHGLRRIK